MVGPLIGKRAPVCSYHSRTFNIVSAANNNLAGFNRRNSLMRLTTKLISNGVNYILVLPKGTFYVDILLMAV